LRGKVENIIPYNQFQSIIKRKGIRMKRLTIKIAKRDEVAELKREVLRIDGQEGYQFTLNG